MLRACLLTWGPEKSLHRDLSLQTEEEAREHRDLQGRGWSRIAAASPQEGQGEGPHCSLSLVLIPRYPFCHLASVHTGVLT